MSDISEARASFHDMAQSTQGDWAVIMESAKSFSPQGGRRVLDHLRLLDGDFGGFAVDRLTHCRQTATRAHRDGRAQDYVVMALLHDIGDTLGAFFSICNLIERRHLPERFVKARPNDVAVLVRRSLLPDLPRTPSAT